jgi:hypothetical protein
MNDSVVQFGDNTVLFPLALRKIPRRRPAPMLKLPGVAIGELAPILNRGTLR